MNTSILRKPIVLEKTGLSNSSLYRKVADGTFPAPLSLGPRAVGWLESSVDEWIMSRPQALGDIKHDREPPQSPNIEGDKK